jgi:hypothetical protein
VPVIVEEKVTIIGLPRAPWNISIVTGIWLVYIRPCRFIMGHLGLALLTEKELLQRLQVTRGTLLKLRKKGLPHVRVSRRLIRYVYEDVVAWLKSLSPSYPAGGG